MKGAGGGSGVGLEVGVMEKIGVRAMWRRNIGCGRVRIGECIGPLFRVKYVLGEGFWRVLGVCGLR